MEIDFNIKAKVKGTLIIALAVLGVLVWLGLSGHISWTEVYEGVLRFLPVKK